MSTPDLAIASDAAVPLTIVLAEVRATTDLVGTLADVLIRHPGDAEVLLRLERVDAARIFELPYRVRRSTELTAELKSLLGRSAIAS